MMMNEEAMTNEEAIKTLKANYPDACFEQLREAVDAAISALKAQQAAGDAISRRAALDALRTCYDTETVTMSNGDEYINYEDAVGEIEQLSSASQQKPEWAQKVEEYRKSAPSFVRNPLVWALYQTWKEYDEQLFNHSRQAAGDTISRQEAIAATRNAKISFTIKSDIDFANYRKEIQEIFNNILDAQEKALKELPSARPEVIRCKECKHWLDIDDGRQKHRMCADIYGDWYCADAERRTDE